MTSYTVDVSDALATLSCQPQQPSLASVVFYLLSFTALFLLAVLLLINNKPCVSRALAMIPAAGGLRVVGNYVPEPPSPWGNFPLVGHLPWLGAKPYVTMLKLSRRYGSIYQLQFGCRKVVVLNGLEAIRQAFVRQGDAFTARPHFPSFAKFCQGRSIAFSSLDHVWIVQRKMAMRALGMFTSSSRQKGRVEALIQRQAVALADVLLHDSAPVADKPPVAVDPFGAIESAVVTILFELCFGCSSGDSDEGLYSHMLQILHDMRDVMPVVQMTDVTPWLAPFCRRSLQRYTDSLSRIDQLVTDKVDALVSAGVPDQPACIVHALHNACLPGANDNDADSLQHSRITATVQDFIGAGSEGVVQFIHWAILYAAKYPDIVQERVRDEIERTIGWKSTAVGIDRSRMPYTEACMWEIVRHSCLTPMSLPHAALRDTTLAGRTVSAGTVVFANFYSTGWDVDVWGDPNIFRPDRFLTPDGQVDRAVVDRFLCFGVGRRRCLGAQLGRLEMFVFFVVLMQKCTFSAPPNTDLSTDGDFVLTNKSKKFRIVVQPSPH